MTQIIPRDLPIFFDEEKHKYTDALDREYISTTTIIGKFVEQKDWKAIAEACANIGSRPVPPTHRNYSKYIRYRLLNRFLLNGRLKLKRLVLRELKNIIS